MRPAGARFSAIRNHNDKKNAGDVAKRPQGDALALSDQPTGTTRCAGMLSLRNQAGSMIGINASVPLGTCPLRQPFCLSRARHRRHKTHANGRLRRAALSVAATCWSFMAQAQSTTGAITVAPADAARLLIADGQLDAT